MRRVPWHVKGVDPDAREVARDAARRSGLSVGEWLNSLIIDAATNNPPGAVRETASDADMRFAAAGRDIDPSTRGGARPPQPRTRSHAVARHDADDDGIDAALAEITARQQLLDADAPAADDMAAADPARVDQQLRDIAGRIRALQNAARSESRADPARMVANGIPQRTIEGIEAQLRRLTGQLDGLRSAAPDDRAAQALRRDLADIAERIDERMPRGAAASIQDQIGTLSNEIARLGAPPRIEDITAAFRHDLDDIAATLQSVIPQRTAAAIAEEIHALNARIAELAPPKVDEITEALRQDLMEIGAVLHEAMPTNAIAALEQEVRTLGERIEASRGAGAPMLGSADDLGGAFGEARERLGAVTSADDIARLSDAIMALSDKADAMAADRVAGEMVEQLEQAIGALHALVAQAASQDAVDGLARDIHALADKVDRDSRPGPDADIMMTLDHRLAEMADAIGRSRPAESPAVPVDFDSIVGKLAERLESIQVPAVDHDMLISIEQRIVSLSDKLESSEDRIGRLDGVERGMDDLLEQVKELRTQNERKLQAIQQELVLRTAEAVSAPAEAIRRDVATLKEIQTSADRRTHDTFEAVYGTIEQVVDRLAVLEEGRRDTARSVAPAAPAAPAASSAPAAPRPTPAAKPAAPAAPTATAAPVPPAAPSAQARAPIDSALPPDAPLEPGSSPRRVRVAADAIDRIAASEAVNSAVGVAGAKSAEAAPAARGSFVAAARRAAQAVAHHQADGAPAGKVGFDRPRRGSNLIQKLRPRIKSLVVGISVVMLVLGALRLALDLFYNPDPSPPGPPVGELQPAPARAPTATDDLVTPVMPAPPAGVPPVTPAPATPPAPQSGKGASLISPSIAAHGIAAALSPETTLGQSAMWGIPADLLPIGKIARAVPAATPVAAAPAATVAPVATVAAVASVAPDTSGPPSAAADSPQVPAPLADPARDLAATALPATIGGKALVNAAVAGEPGASYEVAIRYTEGRHVPQDLAIAAAWFDRAARRGMAPAQFRLGSMYEKGLGVKKDLDEARRLYLAASDQGNAKAMHNLAVLYAEGLEGKPNYAAAAQWFLKAAAYGIVDSQYNLAILYARGVGIERNLVESYRWFALAAKGGDADAGGKRDEVAARLDPQELQKAKQAVDAFVAARQPDAAIATRSPAGGWDVVAAAAPAKPKAAR